MEPLAALQAQIRACRACRLPATPVVAGNPAARIMVIGQAPGIDPARHLRGPCDISRARRDFGYEPRRSLDAGVAGSIRRATARTNSAPFRSRAGRSGNVIWPAVRHPNGT